MTKTLIHSLTPLYVNVDVNFAQLRPYAMRLGRRPLFFGRYYKHLCLV